MSPAEFHQRCQQLLERSEEGFRFDANLTDDAIAQHWLSSLSGEALILSDSELESEDARSAVTLAGKIGQEWAINGAGISFQAKTAKIIHASTLQIEISGSIEVDGVEIPLEGGLDDRGRLALCLSAEESIETPFAKLAAALSANRLNPDFGGAAKLLDSGTLQSFELSFARDSETAFSFSIAIKPAWKGVFKKLGVTEAVGSLKGSQPPNEGLTESPLTSQCAIALEVKLGGSSFEALMSPKGSSVWVLTLKAGKVPALSTVSALAGSETGGKLDQLLGEFGVSTAGIERVSFTIDLETHKLISAAATAGVVVYGLNLIGEVILPDASISAGLNHQFPVDLKGLLSEFAPVESWMPAAAVDSLQVALDPRLKIYSAAAEISADWRINLGDVSGTIAKVGVELRKSPDGTDASIHGQLTFAGTIFDVSGKTETGAPGWEFEGDTTGDPISLQVWLGEVAPALGVSEIPWTPDLTIEDVRIWFDTATKNYQFDAKASLDENLEILGQQLPVLRAAVELDSERDSETEERKLSGRIVGKLEIGGAGFAITYEFGEKRLLKGVWRNADEKLDASEIPGGFLGEIEHAIPKGLMLKGAAFEYDFGDKSLNVVAETENGSRVFFVFTPPQIKADVSVNVVATSTDNPLLKDQPEEDQTASADAKHGFVFGLELFIGDDGKAKDGLPGDLQNLDTSLKGAQKFFGSTNSGNSTAAAFVALISTVRYDRFKVPQLPALPISDADSSEKPAATPIDSGTMNLQPGISLALQVHFGAPSPQPSEMDRIAQLAGATDLVVMATANKNQFSVLAVVEGDLRIPTPGGASLDVTKAGVSVVADLKNPTNSRFDAFGELTIDLDHRVIATSVVLEVSPEGLQLAANAKGDPSILDGPPGMVGMHLEDIGVVVGVEFEPLGVDFGFEAGFFIQGDGDKPMLKTGKDQGKFVYVLNIVEEAEIPVPDPILLAFSVDEISIEEAIIAVTGKTSDALPDKVRNAVREINKVVKASDVSAYWAQQAVMLPDGSTVDPGFGFSAAINVMDAWEAFGQLNVNEANGVKGKAMMSPIEIGDVLRITGTSEGFRKPSPANLQLQSYSRYVKGKPPEVPKPIEDDYLVTPGGPFFQIDTTKTDSKFLVLSCDVELFESVSSGLELEVGSDEIKFDFSLDIDGAARFDVNADLKRGDGGFAFDADCVFDLALQGEIGPVKASVDVPVFGEVDVDLGKLELDTRIDAKMRIELSKSDFLVKIEGDFDFEGATLSIPPLKFSKDNTLKSLKHLGSELLDHIENEAETIFKDLIMAAARQFADAARKVAEVAKEVGQDIVEAEEWAADEATKAIETADEAEKTVEKGAREVGKQATALAKETTKITKDSIAGATLLANEAKTTATRLANEAATKVADLEHKTEEAAAEATAFVSDTAEQTREVLAETAKEVSRIAGEAEHDANKLVNDAKHDADKIVSKAEKTAKGLYKDAKHLANKAKDLLKDVGSTIKGWFS
ncbi:MAG: hypothetical protein AAF585_02430 [Verrucomicrobiota bacterium]